MRHVPTNRLQSKILVALVVLQEAALLARVEMGDRGTPTRVTVMMAKRNQASLAPPCQSPWCFVVVVLVVMVQAKVAARQAWAVLVVGVVAPFGSMLLETYTCRHQVLSEQRAQVARGEGPSLAEEVVEREE